MKERPILFSGPMVRAILDGRKTMTRRVITQFPVSGYRWGGWVCEPQKDRGKATIVPESNSKYCATGQIKARCPYGQPGDRLWVRETWRIGAWCMDDGQIAVDYKASPEITRTPWLSIPDDDDGEKFNRYWVQTCDELAKKDVTPDSDGNYHWEPGKAPLNWRPSIYMPREDARIILEVVSVRVERVQDISSRDAWNEGATCSCTSPVPQCAGNIDAFRNIWDSINAKRGYGWDANPWVWVVEFRQIKEARP